MVFIEVSVPHQHPILIWAKTNFSVSPLPLVARFLISGENTAELFRHGRLYATSPKAVAVRRQAQVHHGRYLEHVCVCVCMSIYVNMHILVYNACALASDGTDFKTVFTKPL